MLALDGTLLRGELHDLLNGLGSRWLLGLGSSLDNTLLGTTLNFGGTTSSGCGFLAATESNNCGVTLLEVPVILTGNNVVSNTAACKWSITRANLGAGSLNASVTEGLNAGLEFVITVEVGWPSGWVEGFTKLGLE